MKNHTMCVCIAMAVVGLVATVTFAACQVQDPSRETVESTAPERLSAAEIAEHFVRGTEPSSFGARPMIVAGDRAILTSFGALYGAPIENGQPGEFVRMTREGNFQNLFDASGRSILFGSQRESSSDPHRSDGSDLWLYDREQNVSRRLRAQTDVVYATLSADESWVAMHTVDQSIWVQRVDAESADRISAGATPAWHPSEPTLLYQKLSEESGGQALGLEDLGLAIYDAASGVESMIKGVPDDAFGAFWYSDGEGVLFGAQDSGDDNAKLWFARRDGGEVHSLASATGSQWVPLPDDFPSWSDDKTLILEHDGKLSRATFGKHGRVQFIEDLGVGRAAQVAGTRLIFWSEADGAMLQSMPLH